MTQEEIKKKKNELIAQMKAAEQEDFRSLKALQKLCSHPGLETSWFDCCEDHKNCSFREECDDCGYKWEEDACE